MSHVDSAGPLGPSLEQVIIEEKLNLDDSQWEDIHVVTGALKMFFRELPEPLFPYCFFEQFVKAIILGLYYQNKTKFEHQNTIIFYCLSFMGKSYLGT
uniref:Rho GTPase-activating protein 15 n=1 Tax=Sphaerodactylus townsendi TaxID=933632 RepID=A0ACB8G2M3_9SAUR